MSKLLVAIAALGLVALLLGSRWEQWVMDALAPDGPFDAARVPAAPDYADPSAWTAHPAQRDAADVAPDGFEPAEPADAPADVFYVHPTTYLGPAWNGPVDDAELNAQTDELATRIQASAFNGCCAVWGPRYRQANGDAFVRPSADGASAIDVAYADVRAAFRAFLAERGRERPFVLAGHSQGSMLAAQLLAEEIAGSALADRLVAAYLIGAPVDAAHAPVPVCGAPEATGCVVTWNARGPRFAGTAFDLPVAGERACVNPLTWRSDEAPAGADRNEGAVFLHAAGRTVFPHFADARCRDGVLVVSTMGDPPRDFRSRLLDFVIGPENHHPIEVQLYYLSLRRNAQDRVAAWVRTRG